MDETLYNIIVIVDKDETKTMKEQLNQFIDEYITSQNKLLTQRIPYDLQLEFNVYIAPKYQSEIRVDECIDMLTKATNTGVTHVSVKQIETNLETFISNVIKNHAKFKIITTRPAFYGGYIDDYNSLVTIRNAKLPKTMRQPLIQLITL